MRDLKFAEESTMSRYICVKVGADVNNVLYSVF